MATIDELVTEAEKQYIPGVDYTGYFNSAILAARNANNPQEEQVLASLKNSWDLWRQSNTLSSYKGTSTKAEAKKLADAAQAKLNETTQKLADLNGQYDADIRKARTGEELNAIRADYASKLMDAVYTAEDIATEASKTFSEGPKADTTATTDANAAFAEWKKTGLDPNITDPKTLAAYQALKLKEQGVTNVKDAGTKGPQFAAPTLDLATALRDYGNKGLLPDKTLNAPLYNELVNRIAAGTKGTLVGAEPYIGAGAEALSKYLASKPQNVRVDLPQDYATRNAVQDVMLANARANPGMYATGQFDPFYSGVARTGIPSTVAPNVMNAQGVFEKGVGTMAPNLYGFGFQNAYQAPASTVGTVSATTDPTATVSKAAGGYLDAQTIGQQNQQLQAPQNNYSLGLGAIPNMTQYTNYQNNPGITTPTQDTDDGGVGGVPVPGQTNPVW